MKALKFWRWHIVLFKQHELDHVRYVIERLRDPDGPIAPCDDKGCGYPMCAFVRYLEREAKRVP